MSINQFYDDDPGYPPTDNFDVNANRNIKCKNIRSKAGYVKDLFVTNLNGLPPTGGAIPAIGPNHSVLSSNGAGALWSNNITINSGNVLTTNSGSTFNNNATTTNMHSNRTEFTKEVDFIGVNADVEFKDGAKVLILNDSQFVVSDSAASFEYTTLTLDNSDLVINRDVNRADNYVQTPEIRFYNYASSADAFKFYGTVTQTYTLYLIQKAGENQFSTAITLDVKFCRIGSCITMAIPFFRYSTNSSPHFTGRGYFRLNVSGQQPNSYTPTGGLKTITAASVYDSTLTPALSSNGSISIGALSIIRIISHAGDIAGSGFDIQANRGYGLGENDSYTTLSYLV